VEPSQINLFSFVVYVPLDSSTLVKEAMFNAGAGKIGPYEACSWEVQGTGQFRPIEGSNPAVGKFDQLEQVAEVRVEMVCESGVLPAVIEALIKTNPYEEPAYHYLPVNREWLVNRE